MVVIVLNNSKISPTNILSKKHQQIPTNKHLHKARTLASPQKAPTQSINKDHIQPLNKDLHKAPTKTISIPSINTYTKHQQRP